MSKHLICSKSSPSPLERTRWGGKKNKNPWTFLVEYICMCRVVIFLGVLPNRRKRVLHRHVRVGWHWRPCSSWILVKGFSVVMIEWNESEKIVPMFAIESELWWCFVFELVEPLTSKVMKGVVLSSFHLMLVVEELSWTSFEATMRFVCGILKHGRWVIMRGKKQHEWPLGFHIITNKASDTHDKPCFNPPPRGGGRPWGLIKFT